MEQTFKLVEDPVAGFLTVSPTPDLATLKHRYAHEYYDQDKPVYLAKSEAEAAYWDARWTPRLHALSVTPERPGRILDVGASGGFFLNLARRLGFEIEGVEPGLKPAAYAREHFGINLFNGYLEDYRRQGPLFDAVHMSLVLEHVRDPRAFLHIAASHLKPGGALWVEVPNDFNPLQKAVVDRLDKAQWWVVPHHHLNYFNFETLTALFEECGFSVAQRTTSFPMELFVLMGLDYIGNDDVGAEAHRMRMNLEQHLLAADPALLETLYGALAAQGLGRTCNLLGMKRVEG